MLLDTALMGVRFHIGRETGPVQADHRRITDQLPVAKPALVLEQGVVHLPELALRRRGFRGFGRRQRVLVRVRQRKVAEHKSQLASEPPLGLFDDEMSLATMRALEVAELHERDSRIRWSIGVVAF